MNFSYTDAFSVKRTPQSQPIPGKQMVQGRAGGFVFAVDDWIRLDRFLILGSDAPTYYADARELTIENAQAVARCLAEDGIYTVSRIIEISESGMAPKNDPALFALAMASSPNIVAGTKKKYACHECGNDAKYAYTGINPESGSGVGVPLRYFCDEHKPEMPHHEWVSNSQEILIDNPLSVRRLALAALPRVARIGTHLFTFAKYVDHFRGWGRGLRESVAKWYTEKEADRVAYQAVKYQQRGGWSHRDMLRLSHPLPPSQAHDSLFHWITQGEAQEAAPTFVHAFEAAKRAENPRETIKLIQEYNLTREMVKTEHLTDAGVWEALLEKMPMTAMVRNLATMTRVGLLVPMSKAVGTVVSRLDSDAIRKARVHPLQVLVALRTYQQGHGHARQQAVGWHSSGYVSNQDVPTWRPVVQVVDALDAAFYHAFDNVESTGLRWLLALDVSGSMTSPDISGMPGITPRVGSAAMALITAKTEPNYACVGFTSGTGGYGYSRYRSALTSLPLSPRQRLDDVISMVSRLPFGGTDCALPMIGALQRREEYDVFVVYTDSETWAGNIHPMQALNEYRQKMGVPAKLIVCGMTSNGFSIADPDDAGCLDVVGFSTATPALMANFARG